ncbi:glycosyltransferase [Ktedonospora formicarum]|uniref:Glycosyl transferase family 1 n=1 Tax=Ktedonospora formicarum TaxID=2778364 RepID=A0A8J3HZ30_9CHLR|nr:glycosyltransferase [Ktedonospora formicarum]GHO43282.1 glycosyl transferase family 1 [Ktedonospora formicarum]
MLILSAYLPGTGWGASARSYYLLQALASRHDISLIALVSPEEYEMYRTHSPLHGLARHVQLVPFPPQAGKRQAQIRTLLRGQSYSLSSCILPAMQEAIDALCARETFDTVLYEGLFIAGYRLPHGAKVILDQHNIEHELVRRTYESEREPARKLFNWLEYGKLRQGELQRCAAADLLLVTSEREREVWGRLLPGKTVTVVPNGVDVESFRSSSREREKANHIVFTGTMDYYPNSSAVLLFARQCWPLIRREVPEATWQIVGRNPSLEVQRLGELPGITVTGSVPEVQPYLSEAAVSIVPLRVGSGTRLKILEALAMSKAVVTTSIGCEGLEVHTHEHLLIEDQPEDFAHAVVALLRDRERREALGNAGRDLVERIYSWHSCGERLLSALNQYDRKREQV